LFQKQTADECCLTPVILATWEAEIKRLTVRGQPGQIVLKTISKIPNTAGCLWLTSIILATQETEIRRIMVQSQLLGVAKVVKASA
jgi:hypothetical protein